MDNHLLAGIARPLFWLLVLLPFLAGLRWALNRYVRPKLNKTVWRESQKPVGDVGAAVAILVAIVIVGLLVDQ